LEALLLEDVDERLVDRAHAFDAVDDRVVERVEHREHVLDHTADGALRLVDELLAVALLVVLELRLQTLREREVLVALLGDGGDVLLDLLLDLRELGIGGHHLLVHRFGLLCHQADLSSSTISASTTSSSFGGGVAPPPAAPPCAYSRSACDAAS